MKHILYILEAVEGGAWRHLKDLLGAIHGKTVECSVVLSFERHLDNVDEVRSFLASLNVPLYEIPMKRGAAPGDMAAVLKLKKLIRKIQPDLVHAHCAKAGVLGRVAAKLAKVPSIYTPHCFPFFMQDTRCSPVYTFIEKGMVKITSSIIVLSEEEQAAALQLGYQQDRINLIPNGIKSCGLPLPEITEHKPLRLGFFGREGAQKGTEEFVRLVEELNRQGVECVGNVCGSFAPERPTSVFAKASPDKSNIQHRTSNFGKLESKNAKNFIRILGQCPQDQVVERMRSCDVVVMPSRWEGLPYVLLETLDAGVPVSAYRVGGIGDVVEHGESAMLADPEDFEGLVANTATLTDPALRRKLAESGREAVREYSLERMVDSTLEVYKNVCGSVSV